MDFRTVVRLVLGERVLVDDKGNVTIDRPETIGYASAGAIADFIVVDMIGEAALGAKTQKEAASARRYYKL